MSLLYLTADQVGAPSGGGIVTQNEMTALLDLAMEQGQEFYCWGRQELDIKPAPAAGEPWQWDANAHYKLWQFRDPYIPGTNWPQLAHAYAGTFTETLKLLQQNDCKITYTAAAHDVAKSRIEHEKLGIPFNYKHLTDPELWQRYVGGYLAADVLICPSRHAAEVMRDFGYKRRIEVIPHGVELPDEVPSHCGDDVLYLFNVGYLGAVGPDKGLRYLLEAWKKLAYKDARLVLAGRDSNSHFVQELVAAFGLQDRCQLVVNKEDMDKRKLGQLAILPNGGGSILLTGWVPDTSKFYASIDLYVQPSITEGFGCEVLEAMAHGRAVLCSDGAGAADVVPETWRFPAGNVDALAEKIDQFRKADLELMGSVGRNLAEDYTWSKIRARYQQVWRSIL